MLRRAMSGNASSVERDSAVAWQRDGDSARVACGPLSGAVNVGAPARGIGQLVCRNKPVEGWLLGIEFDAQPSDVYVRGHDLVVLYRETQERPFSVEVYWRVRSRGPGDGVILDAIVSIQTRQWEAYPHISLTSSISTSEVASVDNGTQLIRPPAVDWTYAESAADEDYSPQECSDGAALPGTSWTFGEQFMERGVIRRLRVRGAIVPREDDVASAVSIRAALLAERPPLTA